ncbi:cbb3-type cytochrome c oxidase N-terminal domain-containing protein [Sphingobacterium rhinopitheci]|uniref:cbb3-type cytochrome c oxidase N-terminal domain-containing protein n=1 Tax=Sphingobacterium rhinopitheci TaxID=2781960 RepID=UPI001F51A232|nr:cbb3-type cytochrome c oxidase N-terminal domain-containing protein [Sphingobacterium rhinopitheci]
MMTLLIAIEPVVESTSWSFGGVNLYNNILIISLLVVMLVLLFSALVVNKALKSILRITMPDAILKEEENKIKQHEERKSKWNKRWLNIAGLRPIEEEKDLMMDHKFDGISELDNPVPMWFNALFYSTILFGLCYLLIYQVFGWGLNQDQEYVVEMEKAEIAKKEYLAKQANQIDEHSVVFSADFVAAGKTLFMANCVACHGANGEGGIGPNLADRFWIHGGEVKDIFKTIKYGVPEKGMVPWEQTLTPGQIAEVTSYVVSLRDTKPANPKAPEGVEVAAYESESASVEADSTVVN